MGRQGSKRRGTVRVKDAAECTTELTATRGEINGRKPKRRSAVKPSQRARDKDEDDAVAAALQRQQSNASIGAASPASADALACMPWNRWRGVGAAGGDFHSDTSHTSSAKKEHEELARWREESFGNPAFEEYYKKQKVIPSHEWTSFMATLAKPLKTTIRVNSSCRKGASFLRRLQHASKVSPSAVGKKSEWLWRGERVRYLVRRFDRVPSDLEVWEFCVDRAGMNIGQKKLPALGAILADTHEGIAGGYVSRQEVVSMLSARLLGTQPGDRVLDMCAAPGSKTTQLLEALKGSGVVVANDAGLEERIPQLLRVLSTRPASERRTLVVTSGLGETLPFPEFGGSGGAQGFDRVLVDAPCSGDGTIRKAADVLRRWDPEPGLQLHSVQVALLQRGLELLRPGGTLVYSTCSLNPVENEAVVAEALRRCGIAAAAKQKTLAHVELEDIKPILASFLTRTGLRTWQVGDSTSAASHGRGGHGLRWHADLAAARSAGMRSASSSMWPPSLQELDKMNLERCRRVLPQDNDTGGFFLAVFRKGSARGAASAPAPQIGAGSPKLGWAAASSEMHADALQRASACGTAESSVSKGDLAQAIPMWVTPKGQLVLTTPEVESLHRTGWPLVDAGAPLLEHAQDSGCPFDDDGVKLLWRLVDGKLDAPTGTAAATPAGARLDAPAVAAVAAPAKATRLKRKRGSASGACDAAAPGKGKRLKRGDATR